VVIVLSLWRDWTAKQKNEAAVGWEAARDDGAETYNAKLGPVRFGGLSEVWTSLRLPRAAESADDWTFRAGSG
jgi:hypothetical protein